MAAVLQQGRQRDGFTIVELLIVIVVIGILAAITIVAYNGIQSRARSAQSVSAISQYYKGLVSYAAVNGSYPEYYSVCLSDESSTCWFGYASRNSSFTAALKTVMGNSLPVLPSSVTGPNYIGLNGGLMIDGQPRAFIYYQTDPGVSKCDYGAVIGYGGDEPNFNSANVPATYSYNGGSVLRQCFLPLPAI